MEKNVTGKWFGQHEQLGETSCSNELQHKIFLQNNGGYDERGRGQGNKVSGDGSARPGWGF